MIEKENNHCLHKFRRSLLIWHSSYGAPVICNAVRAVKFFKIIIAKYRRVKTMLKIILILLPVFVIGCCPNFNYSSFSIEDEFVGVWHVNNIKDATLRIYPKENHIYLLKFENEEYRWEGVGYQNDNNIIAIFRYKNVNQQGFVTFTLEQNNKMNYISRNQDGSVRASGYYLKY